MQKSFPILGFTIAFLAIASCATPYQDMGFTGGVSASRIDETTLRVQSKGNAYTSMETIQDYVMLKAAEETIANGYDLFLVMDGDSYTQTGSYTAPGTATTYTSGSAYGSSFGNTTNVYGSATSTTYYTPGQTTFFNKPRTNIVVRMFTGPKPDDAPPTLFDARDVVKYLGPQIKGTDTSTDVPTS